MVGVWLGEGLFTVGGACQTAPLVVVVENVVEVDTETYPYLRRRVVTKLFVLTVETTPLLEVVVLLVVVLVTLATGRLT
jgi:hypothetical protein